MRGHLGVQHQPPCVAELVGVGPVCATRFRNATGVVVREYGGAGIDAQFCPHDLTRMDAGTVGGAGEKPLAIQDAMPVIEPKDMELLVGSAPKRIRRKSAVSFGLPMQPCRLSSSRRVPSAAAKMVSSEVLWE